MKDSQPRFSLKKDKKLAKKKEADAKRVKATDQAPRGPTNDDLSRCELRKLQDEAKRMREYLHVIDEEIKKREELIDVPEEQSNEWIERKRKEFKEAEIIIRQYVEPALQLQMLSEAEKELEFAEMGALAFKAWHAIPPGEKPVPLNVFMCHYILLSPRDFDTNRGAVQLVKKDFGLPDLTEEQQEKWWTLFATVKHIPMLIN